MGLSAEQKYALATNIVRKISGPQKVELIKEILPTLTHEAFLDENLKWVAELGILTDAVETKLWRAWRNSDDFLEYRRRARERSPNASGNNTDSI